MEFLSAGLTTAGTASAAFSTASLATAGTAAAASGSANLATAGFVTAGRALYTTTRKAGVFRSTRAITSLGTASSTAKGF
jgi:hypothetical protein